MNVKNGKLTCVQGISRSLWKKFRIMCLEVDKTAGEVINEMIVEKLKQKKEGGENDE